MTIGFHLVCQAQLKGQPWRFATFFSGFRWTWPLAGRAALLFVAEVVLLVPAFAILGISRLIWREPPAAVAGGTAVLLLGCLLASGYIVVRLMFFSHLLIIDRGCGPIQALRGSWLLSRGHFWGLYGLLLLVLLLPLLGLGVLIVLPVVILTLDAGYLLVAGTARCRAGAPGGAGRPAGAVAVGVAANRHSGRRGSGGRRVGGSKGTRLPESLGTRRWRGDASRKRRAEPARPRGSYPESACQRRSGATGRLFPRRRLLEHGAFSAASTRPGGGLSETGGHDWRRWRMPASACWSWGRVAF